MNNIVKNREYWQGTWELFKSGNRVAFREIYNEFVDVLFAYGLKITNNRELVHDCIQELFINLYRYRENLNSPDYLEFYLFKSLRRLIIHELKKDKQLYRVNEQDLLSFQLKFDLEEDQQELESLERRSKSIKDLLANLDPQKRELLYLKFYSGLNYREIGNMLGIKPDTAKKQVYRLLEDLRDKFGEKLLELLYMCFRT